MHCPGCGRECEWNPCEYCSGRLKPPFETQEEQQRNHAVVEAMSEGLSQGYSAEYVRELHEIIKRLSSKKTLTNEQKEIVKGLE